MKYIPPCKWCGHTRARLKPVLNGLARGSYFTCVNTIECAHRQDGLNAG